MEIRLNKIKKFYENKLVLDINNHVIKKGKITAITGANGAGKTTLLKIIAGLDKNFSGIVTYNGQQLNKELSKELTIVFQESYLFRRSVYENILYPLKVRNVGKIEGRLQVEGLLEKFEISSLRDQNAQTLSGGESQKVSLARALIFQPKLLLLDEPTSNIDPNSLRTLEREILRYNHDTGATIVIITHSMEQAERLCNEFVHVKNGKIAK